MKCEHCIDLGRYKSITATVSEQVAADDEYVIDIPVNYCPSCGKQLKTERRNHDDNQRCN